MKRPEGSHPIYWRTFHSNSPTDWQKHSISSLCSRTKGKLAIDLSDRFRQGAKQYLLTGLLNGDETVRYTFQENITNAETYDTLMAVDGTVGKVFTGLEGVLGSTMMRFRPYDVNDSSFLFYLLQSLESYSSATAIVGAVPHLDKRLISQLVLAIPEQQERILIGNLLSSVDKAVFSTKTEVSAAKHLQIAMMQQLFTKGIPGKHNRFINIKRGMMPASWELMPVSKLADVDAGVTLNPDRAPRSNSFGYLTVINVQRDYIDLTEKRYLELWPSEVPIRLLKEEDILVVEGHANSSEIGRAAMVNASTSGMAFQNHLFRLRVNVEDILPEFLLYTLNSERVRRHWNAVCNTSSGLNTINRRQVRRLDIPTPTIEEQKEITGIIGVTKATIRSCEETLKALMMLKKSLLQNLLTGKVRVNMEAKV